MRRLAQWWRRPTLAGRIAGGFFVGYSAAILLLLYGGMFTATWLGDSEGTIGAEVAAAAALADLRDDTPLRLPSDGEVARLAARSPSFWLVAQRGGERLTFGRVPPEAAAMLKAAPDSIETADLRLPAGGGAEASAALRRRGQGESALLVAAGGVGQGSIGIGAFARLMLWSEVTWVILLFAGLAVPAVAVAVARASRAVRPLAAAAERIDQDGLETRLPEASTVAELRPLAGAFNAALDRVQRAFERQRAFIADVSHELRTPIAVLSLHAEALPDGATKAELQRGLARLGHMVGQMLDAERLTLAGRRRDPVDLVTMARAVAADFAPLAVAHGYELEVRAGRDAVPVSADAPALSRALGNLVANAIAHGGNRGRISVDVRPPGLVEVSDEGDGVAPDAAERIFEPFRRERWDRDGCGLGLHLARAVLRAHGGDVSLVPAGRGATFRLEVPGDVD